jgi:four helix bundle protein
MSSTYRDLRVWREAMKLAVAVYKATESFPAQERYGITAQIRRSAVSIPSNIAEGKGRRTDRDFLSFLFRARGSRLELETQLLLATELGYLVDAEAQQLLGAAARVGSALAGLINSLSETAAATGA